MESIKEMEKNSKILSAPVTKVGAIGIDGCSPDEKFNLKADQYGECKICKERHTYVNKFTKRISLVTSF